MLPASLHGPGVFKKLIRGDKFAFAVLPAMSPAIPVDESKKQNNIVTVSYNYEKLS